MRPHGETKLGFFPLPVPEAARLTSWLGFASDFSALDPCVGDGVAFTHLLQGVTAYRYGIEIDANPGEQAKALGVVTLQVNAMDVRRPPEAVSLLYLNPPYDWESGESNNQRLESVFLEHSYRWLNSEHRFLWASIAHIHGIPGMPDWADWFAGELQTHRSIMPALGIGCDRAIVQGHKEQFLGWLSWGVESEAIRIPASTGSIRWPRFNLADLFLPLK